MRSILLVLVPLLVSLQDDPARWIERLGSESAEERAQATKALRSLGAAALPALQKARQSPDAETATRAAALVSLIETEQFLPAGIRKAVPDLAERLATLKTDWASALLDLGSSPEYQGRIRGRDLEPLIPRALADAPDQATRNTIIFTMAALRIHSVLPQLYLLLADPDTDTRMAAIRSVSAIDPASALRITPSLRSPDVKVVETALEILGGLRSTAALLDIAPLLKDERIWIRMRAIDSVGAIGGPEAGKLLVPMLGDANPDVRNHVRAMLLGKTGPEYAPLHVKMLSDPDPMNRLLAVRALKAAEIRESGPEMLKLLNDADASVRSELPHALLALRTPALDRDLLRHLERDDPAIQAAAVEVLGHFRMLSARGEVLRRLDSASPLLRRAAVGWIERTWDWESVPALLARMDDPDPGVRAAIFSVLTSFHVEAVIPKLIAALQDPDARKHALSHLNRLGCRDEAARVGAFFDDPDSGVREAARAALEHLDPQTYRERIVPDLLRRLDIPEERARALDEVGEAGVRALSARLPAFLEDEDQRVRAAAMQALITLGAVDQIPAVLLRLKHPRSEVRDDAIWTLQDLGNREVARDLLPLLKDPDDEVRRRVAKALAVLQGIDAAASLEGLLADPSPQVRSGACFELSQVNARDRAGKIAPLLQDAELEVRSAAAVALNALDVREHALALAALLKNPESNGHGQCPYAYAQDALRRWKSPEAVPLILGLLRDPSNGVRLTALTTLETMEAAIPPDALLELLEDPYPMIRAVAASHLAEAKARQAVPKLRALLEDEDGFTRVSAAAALMDLADAQGERALESFLGDRDPHIRGAAARAVRKSPLLVRLLQDPEPWVRDVTLKRLADLGAREAIPAIAELLQGPCRTEAAQALGRLRSDAHASELARLLGDPDYQVRSSAGAALQALDPKAAAAAFSEILDHDPETLLRLQDSVLVDRFHPLDALLRRSRDPDPQVRLKTIPFLGGLSDPAARKALTAALGDLDPRVRQSAVEELGKAGEEALLLPLLRDPQVHVRIAAAKALSLRGKPEGAKALAAEGERWTDVPLMALNAVRRPKEWAVLAAKKAGRPPSSSTVEVLRALGAACGLRVEFPTGDFNPSGLRRFGDGWYDENDTVAQALDDLLTRERAELIVEEGKLRILSPEDALAFWKSWAKRKE